MSFRFLLFVLILSIEEVCAQDTFDDYLEQISESNQNVELSVQLSELYTLHNRPVNINDSDLSELLCIPCILRSDIERINIYKHRNGRIRTIQELKLIIGITIYKYKVLKLFTKVSLAKNNNIHLDSTFLLNSHHQLMLKTSKNFINESLCYKGDMWKFLMKYSCENLNGLSFGITTEKDAGEKFFSSNYCGMDFNSGYIQLVDIGKFKQINIGDFSVKWGQGLVSAGGFGCNKSTSSIVYGGTQNLLHRYTSANENGFYRGIGLVFKPTDGFNIIPILSCKRIDAKIDEKGIYSLYNSGYHRTSKELLYKNSAKQTVLGCRLDYSSKMYSLGYNVIRYSYSPDLLESKYMWKQNEFYGEYNYNTSIDYRFSIDNFYFFGESAMSRNKSFAYISGVNFMSVDNVQCSIIYRNYSKLYQGNLSRSFGEYHNTQNERGLYLGIEFYPVKCLKVNAYYDQFVFPSCRYRMKGGGKGKEYLLNLNYTCSPELCMELKYKNEEKPLDIRVDKYLKTLNATKSSVRYTVKYNFSELYSINSRFEYSLFKHFIKNEDGYLAYLDFVYSSLNEKLKCQTRFLYFNTDTYNTRIYTYENDVLYSFSFPAYFGKGYRFFTNVRYKANKTISCYFKYGLTYKAREITNNEFKCQIKVNF